MKSTKVQHIFFITDTNLWWKEGGKQKIVETEREQSEMCDMNSDGFFVLGLVHVSRISHSSWELLRVHKLYSNIFCKLN